MAAFGEFLSNYLFLQSSMLLFVAPFYLSYRLSRPGGSSQTIPSNQDVEQFLASRQANLLAFCWAAAEAVAWFVIPEFLLLVVIFVRVKNKTALLVADIVGTFVGTVVGIMLSVVINFAGHSIPYITQGMIDQVHVWYQELDAFGLLFQPFSGIPYKVFVLNVHLFPIHLVGFVLLAVIVRVARYYLFYLIFVGLHPFLYRFVSRHYLPVVLLSCLVFSFFFLRVYQAFGADFIVSAASAQQVRSWFALVASYFGA